MRWKLLLIASLLAAIVGGGLPLLVLTLLPSYAIGFAGLGFALITLVPAAAITYSTIFVYRHTARRRALQAALTASIAACLIILILFVGLNHLVSSINANRSAHPTSDNVIYIYS